MKRLLQQLTQLFKRKQPEITYEHLEEFDGPLFDVGQRVLVINPNMIDPPEEPPETGIIYEIAYLPEIDEYAYKLQGSTFYYNENWLQEDIYGPKYYPVRQERPVSNKERIDNLLEIYAWNKRMWLRTGEVSYLEKIELLEEELKELT